MLEKYVKKILASRVYDVAIETPLQRANTLSQRTGHTVLLKREDLQEVFSFKIRGSYNKMALLSEHALQKGVIAASAGNHAQGVALSARKLNATAHIVMGKNTPVIKVNAVKRLGARVILHGDSYDDALLHARKLQEEHDYTFVHPYDDPDVIAGQGTIGMEMLNQCNDLDVIFVPVGGGGLVAGIAAYVKYLKPHIKIVGVEAEGSACLSAAREANRRVKLKLDSLDLFADGISVAQIGKHPFDIAKQYVDASITVTTDEICAAIKDIFDDTRSIAEPAGAVAVAGLKKYSEDNPEYNQQTYAAVVSGANVNFDRLRHIAERAEIGEHREMILAVTIPEQPGSFLKFCKAVGKKSITEFNYRYSDAELAKLYVGVQVDSDEGRYKFIEKLRSSGYVLDDMTDNEVAKTHVRYMIGGKGPAGKHELLYRFEFPERPGALANFLIKLGNKWNISLFHYRNHGAAYGRVLVAFQAQEKDRKRLSGYLEIIGYRFREETDNPAYHTFLNN
ncbi:MAG: threonine ammonia-lyase, biosynthetic [Pseudomonadales bacterium]|nr:threonine ammonia-lyase, biosynthetic [Pseudomonadales bacterium]